MVLVDELDYMLTQRQEVLYNLFEWPGRKNAGLAVIGIANTLDLPERLDPKVRSRLGSRRLTFATYKPAQIESILTQRLSAGDLSAAFQPQAVTMAARKIAAYSGDVRKALCICARPRRSARSGSTTRGGREDATKEAQYVVTIADINNAYRLLSDSSYLGAIEHAAPLEQLVLIALCARSCARASRRRRRSTTSRGASRGSWRSRATRATRRARRRTASRSRSSTASPTRGSSRRSTSSGPCTASPRCG